MFTVTIVDVATDKRKSRFPRIDPRRSLLVQPGTQRLIVVRLSIVYTGSAIGVRGKGHINRTPMTRTGADSWGLYQFYLFQLMNALPVWLMAESLLYSRSTIRKPYIL
jgi:hypothetical protein